MRQADASNSLGVPETRAPETSDSQKTANDGSIVTVAARRTMRSFSIAVTVRETEATTAKDEESDREEEEREKKDTPQRFKGRGAQGCSF